MNKISTLLNILALVVLSAFAGALLFIAVAIVNFWKTTPPELFFSWMSDNFWRFPTIMVPLNLAALLLLILTLVVGWKIQIDRRLPLGLALLPLVACTLTFPIYFAGANAEFLTRSIPLTDVAEKITIWSQWHLLRTVLVILAIGGTSWSLLVNSTPASRSI